MPQIIDQATEEIVARYLSVWSEPEEDARRAAVAALWSAEGAEFVEAAAFRGHDELTDRVAGAYEEFVASGRYAVTAASDISRHQDIVMLTIQLTTPAGQVAWAARVFLLLGPDGSIMEDYQLTVQPFAEDL